MRKFFLLSTFYFLISTFLLYGCATLKESAKAVAGVSTKSLEQGREDAIIKSFNYDYSTCYTKTLEILKHANTYIYVQDIKEQIIAIYVSEQDTTPVGIFFKEIDAAITQVEIYSPSTYAKELIAKRVFTALEER